MAEEQPDEQKAAPPDFASFIATDNKGRTNAAISEKLAALVAAVQNVGKGGEVNIKIKVDPWAKNDSEKVKVTVATAAKVPVEAPLPSLWFMGVNGALLKDDPADVNTIPGFTYAEIKDRQK